MCSDLFADHSSSKMNGEVSSRGDSVNANKGSHCISSEADSSTGDAIPSGTRLESNRGASRKNHQQYLNPTNLQVHKMKERILDAIESEKIVIIKGETGCGKTTQIPQFILDSSIDNSRKCSIVVTQPRRIAAITVATRVAAERRCALGTAVGYQIGLDKKGNDDTRILYVTTGVLLQKLILRKNLNEFTHYIIDEIHERSQDMDFLLIVLRHFLNLESRNKAKLIVMSATIDEKKLRQYLATYYDGEAFEPVIIDITQRTQFTVQKFFLDDLFEDDVNLLKMEPDHPHIAEDVYTAAARIIQHLDRVDQDDLDDTAILGERPAVLVFLPGLHEIEKMEKTLKIMSTEEQYQLFWVKPLHSSVTSDEQQSILMKPPRSKRKIILSTNIAESSVTVTDMKYVIDFCLTKSLVTDPDTGCSFLELEWAPKTSLRQRAGRVGRIASGRVYRMITSSFYENHLDEMAKPEILRCPLESLVLKAKLLEMGPPRDILELAMDPPDLGNLVRAVALLKQIGALLVCVEDEYYEDDGDLTLLGEIIANLPLDVRLGKLIFLGIAFGVPEDCIIMACAMGSKNLFSSPYGKHMEAYDMKLWWADSTRSDCFAFLNAYKKWRESMLNRDIENKSMPAMTGHYFLQMNALREVATLQEDVTARLRSHDFYIFEEERVRSHAGKQMGAANKSFFIKLAIAGAFYPNYFVRSSGPTQMEEEHALHVLGGHDPFSTVYLLGLPCNQPMPIYKNAIKKQFHRITERLTVNTDNGSKAYVTFHPTVSNSNKGKIPGRIEMGVYRALKMRQTGVKISVPRINDSAASRLYNAHLARKKCPDEEDMEVKKILNKLVWPWHVDANKKRQAILEVKISHIESPQRFWIQSSLKNAELELDKLNVVLNAPEHVGVLVKLPKDADLMVGSLYVARLGKCEEDDQTPGVFRRCRIVEKIPEKRMNSIIYSYTVNFVDYGCSRTNLYADEIYDVDPKLKKRFFFEKLPSFAVECSLVKVQPRNRGNSENLSQNGWNNAAISLFQTLLGSSTIAKVYSVVNQVLRVKIVLPNLKGSAYSWKNTINHKLIEDRYATKVDEDYISLCDRDKLKKFFNLAENNTTVREDESLDIEMGDDFELPPSLFEGYQTDLKGPHSPLEMEVVSMTRDKAGKRVNVERDSVNSVLLDTEPSDPQEKMIVAAYVSTNQLKDHLILRHTTMMPNLRALPMLCCLLFAPMVELRVNPSFTRYTGALCGLGYDKKTKKSFFPANDLSVIFDCEITEVELQTINRLRHRLNGVVHPKMELSAEDLADRTERLRDGLKELFFKTSYELQPLHHDTRPYDWGLVNVDELRNPRFGQGPQHPAEDFSTVYRMIWAVSRFDDWYDDEERKDLSSRLSILKQFSEGCSSRKQVGCPLCGISLYDVPSAKMHLKTVTHRARCRWSIMKGLNKLSN